MALSGTTLIVLTFLLSYSLNFSVRMAHLPGPLEWLLEQVRKIFFFEKMLSCSFCTGFWTGLVSFALLMVPLDQFPLVPLETIRVWVAFGFCSSIVCYIMDLIVLRLDTIGEEVVARYLEASEHDDPDDPLDPQELIDLIDTK